MFSAKAISVWSVDTTTINSPDQRNAILVKLPRHPDSDETHSVMVKAGKREFNTNIGEWANAEVLWAPDSSAFAVTYSEGGNIGSRR
jgi:hypothetical protein